MVLLTPLLLALVCSVQSEADLARFIEQLGSDFLEDREAGRRELDKAGPKAEALLLRALSSPDHRVRRSSLQVLAGFRSAKARVRAAELFAGDEDASVQEAAFQLLRELGREAEAELIRALAHESVEVRRGAVETLKTLQSPNTVEPLAELFKRETDRAVKEAVFRSLLSMGAAAQGFLLSCLGSGEARERREALAALRDVETPVVLERIGRLFAVETDADALRFAGDYLEKAGPAAEPFLAAGLRGARELVRLRALQGLAVLRSRAGLEGAAALLIADPSEPVRSAAAEYLAELGGPEAEAAFLKGLAGTNPGIRLLSIQKLGGLRSPKPLGTVAQLFRSEKDPALRRACFDYLRRLGRAAEQELLLAMSDEDRTFRIEAVRALGEAGAEAAIPRLVLIVGELEPELRSAAEEALARLGPKALQAARAEVEAGRLKARSLEAVLSLHHQEAVEQALDRLVTEQGGTGFFGGQFKPLAALGPEVAGPVLLRMVQDPRFAYRKSPRRDRIPNYDNCLRELAVMALGELAVPGAADALERLLQETQPASRLNTLHEEALLSLHRLGRPAPLEAYLGAAEARVEELLGKGERLDEACDLLFKKGMLLNRAGRREASAAAYRRLLAVSEKPPPWRDLPLVLYNLACLASMGGEKARAVEWLERAVRAGYQDRAWIELDQELDAIRGEEGYRKLLADEKLLPKAAPPK